MTTRIHFTPDDVARTRLAGPPSALTAAVLSVHRLAPQPGPPAHELWRRTVRAAGAAPADPLNSLLPQAPSHPLPGFLRPPSGAGSLEGELERLRTTPRAALTADLAHLATARPLPPTADALATGDPAALATLAGAIRAYHARAVAPYWPALARTLDAERAARTRQLRDHGVGAVLNSLSPLIRWRPPVLEVTTPHEYDLELAGRGLLLAPAPFCSYLPCDPEEPHPTLHYEVPTTAADLHPGRRGPYPHLAGLLGHSRAAVLEALAEPASTGQLAHRTGLSPASASEHTAALRRGGLVATAYPGRTSRHTLTPLGAELLAHAAESTVPTTHERRNHHLPHHRTPTPPTPHPTTPGRRAP